MVWDYYSVHGRLSTGNQHLIDGFFQLEVSSPCDEGYGDDMVIRFTLISYRVTFPLQEDCAIIATARFKTMKSSLLCLILALDLEEHNWHELVRAYQQLGNDTSEEYINLLVRRGITMALQRGGLPAATEFWVSLQQQPIISDPYFLAITDQRIETGDLDNVTITNDDFVTRFLAHVRERFGPFILLPSIQVPGMTES